MKILRQGSELPDDRLMFDLALGPATSTRTALIGGGAHGFATIAKLHAAWGNLLVKHSIIAPPAVTRLVPASLAPVVFDPTVRSSELWQSLNSAGFIMAGVDMQLSSVEQTLIAKLLSQMNQPILLSDEVLGLWQIDPELRLQSNISIMARVDTLLKFAQLSRVEQRRLQARGMFGVAERIGLVSRVAPIVVAYGDDACYIYVRTEDSLVFTSHSMSPQQVRLALLALMPITIFARTDRVGVLDRARVLLSMIARLDPNDFQTDQWIKTIRQQF